MSLDHVCSCGQGHGTLGIMQKRIVTFSWVCALPLCVFGSNKSRALLCQFVSQHVMNGGAQYDPSMVHLTPSNSLLFFSISVC